MRYFRFDWEGVWGGENLPQDFLAQWEPLFNSMTAEAWTVELGEHVCSGACDGPGMPLAIAMFKLVSSSSTAILDKCMYVWGRKLVFQLPHPHPHFRMLPHTAPRHRNLHCRACGGTDVRDFVWKCPALYIRNYNE